MHRFMNVEKSELFWDFMQRRMVIPYRHFGPILKNQVVQLDSWPLKMGLIGCPETSVRNYNATFA